MYSSMVHISWIHLACMWTFVSVTSEVQASVELFECNNDASANITIGVVLERSAITDFPFSINKTHGLISIAINRTCQLMNGMANMRFVVIPCDVSGCISLKWGALFAEMHFTYAPHAVIGPGCTPSVATISRMAVAWSVPHFTYVGMDVSLNNKREFSLLTRMSYTLNAFAKFYLEVFDAFGWTDIANIYDPDEYLSNLIGTSFQASFQALAIHIHSSEIHLRQKTEDIQSEILRVIRKASSVSRVFIVVCHGDVFRQMVLMASEILPLGDYVFIFFFQFSGDFPIGEYHWARGDLLDQTARKAYESVMVIRPRRPVTAEFEHFEKEVKRRSPIEYNYTWQDGHEVSLFNIAQYDSFILYALALNETLAAGENPRNGPIVVRRMWNRTFEGIGGPAYVNANGDRDTDFTLLDLNPNNGEFQVVAQYLGWTNHFEFMSGVNIHWPGRGATPPNRPSCGFNGELCVDASLQPSALVGISIGAVIVVFAVIAGLVYRRTKAEAEIYSQWWRVRSEDITMTTQSSFFSRRSDVDVDERSLSLATHAVCFQTSVMYKGTMVYMRKPKVKSISVDRAFMLEMKQMRDITCPNLTRLIGVCPDTNNVCILTEYCSRGNLQDILQNESIQLDWDFKLSLINDIVEGMHYLHATSMGVHGRLTSSRCVIDSRFVLKITGFGLNFINKVYANKMQAENMYVSLPELLWMAPEHLRVYPPRQISQSGDVYSFAIILYEMCTRTEPYTDETWYQSLDDTLRRIKRGSPCVRPTLKEEDHLPSIVNLTKCCWHEITTERPSFSNVRKVIKGIRMKRDASASHNVMDVLLRRMEQYANNLEGLVEAKTQALLDEKRRSEELLYQVLPKSVANQLLTGKSANPEAFGSVTVYFSDIVGFTSMSAVSTAFQVVEFLNDLYTCFDTIIEHYDVYKVETIGDAYMVVSGLPERNGIEHVRQIARMSLTILRNVRQFVIRHMPQTSLKARIGLHSGPVCAGVVGRKMPRYCLFGDTVNTASRMESSGEAMKIHISDETRTLLKTFETFVITKRGIIEVKGKGSMTTYWLIDEITTQNDGLDLPMPI